MSLFQCDCPRCGIKEVTFDCLSASFLYRAEGWKYTYEVFCICRKCRRSSVLVLQQKASDHETMQVCETGEALVGYPAYIDSAVDKIGVVSLKDLATSDPPEHLPQSIEKTMIEANTCLSTGCWNAAAAMYRLSLDQATKELLPSEGEPNARTRRSLGLRIAWLLDNGILPQELSELAECIKDDGNDGAHDGSLQKEEAEDLHDFSFELLKRLYTEPKRLEIAKERRASRRQV